MIELHPIDLADKGWIDDLVWKEGSSSADFNFGNLYLWDKTFKQQVGRLNDRILILPCYEEKPFWAWPVGTGELEPVLREMQAYAKAHDFPFVLRSVTAEHLPLLDGIWPGKYTVQSDRDLWDYLYTAEKLAELSGKKLHGKRNHINRFEAENNWRFHPMTAADYHECKLLLDQWMADSGESAEDGILDEYEAIGRAVGHFDELGLEGGVLRVDDDVVAFTVGEPICEHTFDVHFEKARSDINGAYPMINREFVRQIRQRHPGILWINREDDTGREGLRKSKESYYPDKMVEKYTVVIQDD